MGQLCLTLPMEEGGVDGHVTVLCLIIYLGYMVSLAIWHTEFVFFRGCLGDLVSYFKMRRKQCCPKSSSLTFPTLGCVFFVVLWMEGPLLVSPWLALISSVMTSCCTKDSLTIRPRPCRLARHWFACLCTLTVGLENLIKMCLLWIIVQKQLREGDGYGMSIKTRYVRDQAITAKTWCFPPSASLLHNFSYLTLVNLSGKFSNNVVQVFFGELNRMI